MDDFLDALLAANPQDLILFPAIGDEEVVLPQDEEIVPPQDEEIVLPQDEEIVFPQDGRLVHLGRLGWPAEPIFQPVLQNPDEYLMPRYHGPFVELPNHWEKFSGDNYLGLQQHRQEELDLPELEELNALEQEELDAPDQVEVNAPEQVEVGLLEHKELDAPEQVEVDLPEQEELDAPEQVEVDFPKQEELDAPEQVEVNVPEQVEVDLPKQEEVDAPEQMEKNLLEQEELDAPEQVELDLPEHVEVDLPEQVEVNALEQVEDTKNSKEDSDERNEIMDCTKASSQDVDAMPSASQHITKRDDSISDDCCLMNDCKSPASASLVATFGFQDSDMPGCSSAAFGPTLERGTTSEVRKPTSDQVDGLDA